MSNTGDKDGAGEAIAANFSSKPVGSSQMPCPAEAVIDDKIRGQLADRGWTEQEVRELSSTQPIGTSVDNRRSPAGEPASVYGTKNNGYVVVNDRTKEVVQVSDKNDPSWIPDRRIKWTE